MKVIVYTALYGGHSKLKEFDAQGYECLCVSDEKIESKTWQPVQVKFGMSPRLAAKYPKVFPRVYLVEHDISIWIDSTVTVTDMRLLVATCLVALEESPLALFLHPERQSIIDEARVSEEMPKYRGQPLVAQAMTYLARGLPADHKLYAGGIIARRKSDDVLAFEKKWMSQIDEHHLQDQISLPYALWKMKLEPAVIPGSVYRTDFHTHQWEGPDK